MTEARHPYPLMCEAIADGDAQRLAALFREFPDMVSLDVPGFGSWLHYAAAHGTLEVVKFLVDSGFDVDSKRRRTGEAPLSKAADNAQVEIAEYLLGRGAAMDVGAPERNPLFAAVVGRSPEIARLLLDHGVDSRVRYDGYEQPMDAVAFAMMRGEREIARMIALHNTGGDESAAAVAMAEGLRIAHANTEPVSEDDESDLP